MLCYRKMVEKIQDKCKPPAVHVQLVPFFYGELPLLLYNDRLTAFYLYCCNYNDILVCPKDAFFTDCFYLVYYSYMDGPLYCICTAQLLCFYVRLGTITFILYVCMYIYTHEVNSIDC